MKPIKIYLSLLLLSFTFSLTAQSENALNFDGVNDAVNLPAGLNGAIGSYTLQAWIKTTDASGVRAIVVRSGFHGIFLNNNFLAFYNWSTGNFVGGSSVALNDNQWHHVAATFTHGISFSGQLYIDGVPTGGGFTPGINSVANNYSIGHNLNGQFFNGNIDNVIIHNRVLNATEILDSYNSCSVATGNLKASYNFNQGISQGNNAGINTLLDQSGNNYSGTLVNFTLSGSASNWVDGRSCCFSLASISGATSYCLGETFNLTASFSPRIGESITSYQWKKNGVNLSDGGNVSGATSANLQIANTVSSDFGTYSVEVTSTCGNASASSNITQLGLINLSNLVAHYPFDNNSAIDVSGNNYNATGLNIISTVNRFNQANSAFSFDGVASNVTIAAPTGQTILGNGQNKSISLWFKRSSTTSKGMLLSYQQATPGSWNPLAYIGNDGVLRGWMYQGGTAPWSSGVIIDTNWHHLALVYTTNVQTVYLDGSQVTTMSGTLSPGASNIIMIGNGYANTGITGISVTGNQPFSGIIDEVRFYNAALSLADVNTIATTPFIITNQPQGVCAPIGSQASVSINVSGSVTYQWRQNGINIPGATSNTYTISNVQSSDFGLYSCVIASQCDNTISSVSNEVSVGLPISIPQPSRVYTFNNHHEDHLLRGAYHSVLNQTTNTPATLGSDRFGAANSAHFRGNWSSVSLNRALNLPNMTISMWVNLNNATGTHVFLSPPTNTLPYHLFSENGQLKIRPSSGSDIIIPYVLPSSGWVQITMVYQGNTNIVYVNGEHKFTTSTGINPSTNAIGTIAGLPGGAVTARYLLDDVYVFEQAFTAAEVEGLYADGDKVPYFYIEPINDLVCESNAIRFNFQSAVPGSLVTVKKNGVDLPAGGNVLITDTSVVITNPTSADFTNYTISIRNGCGSVSKTVNAVNYSPGFESIGLVRYFMFNNNLNDAQGGPSLSVGGGINYTSDRFGNANAAYQQYNGSILLLPSTAVVNNSPFTVNFWVNGYPTGSSYQLFSSGSPTSVGLSAQNQYLGFSLGNNNVGFKQYNAFTGGWCMLTMSFDGQIVKIYSNEKLVSVHRPQNATTYLQTFIDQLQCQIDDIRIYNRVLADEEVRGLYRISNITQQPQNQSVCEGQTANLSVNAQNMGGNNLTYQWNFNGNPLSDGGGVSGANTNNLQISNAQASNAGTYNCIINSGCTDINSSNVTLSVGAGNVNITQQPQSISVCAGSPTSFSTATQGATVTYQWKKDGANISGATNSTLNLSNVSLAEAGSYTVDIIGGSCGTISSQSGTLTIFSLPLASITPASPTICSGQSIALTANGGTSYSWDNGLGLGDVITVTPTSNTTYTVLV
ncbi:MAG: LamG-like jellyroll fold domain-containing protein, partial [Flavobacteriia bacterium]